MPIRDLKAQIGRLPEQPGVYVYYNDAGDTLYVGKARVLRDRVRSYLGAHGTSPRIDALLDEAQRLEVIVTDSVMEALALENHLIKQRTPRYNILLRDDKNYPYLQLTTGEAFPRVLVARRVQRDGHYYAGPFLPASLGRRTMALTHRLFGIRSCNEVITGERGRPCLEFDIKRCIAPCVREICSPEEYRVAVEHTQLFLEGRNDVLVETLRDRMQDAADAERFEQAAQLRDAIRTIDTLANAPAEDVERRARRPRCVRSESGAGRGVGPGVRGAARPRGRADRARDRRCADHAARRCCRASRTCCRRRCSSSTRIACRRPRFTCRSISATPTPTCSRSGCRRAPRRRVRLVVPKRGEKRGLLELAARNAEVAYQQRFNENTAANYDALETLRAVLALPAVPRRIECFDISTIQGSETVASMVVCEDGRMRKGEYRKFRIRGDRGSGSGLGASAEPGCPDEAATLGSAAASRAASLPHAERGWGPAISE